MAKSTGSRAVRELPARAAVGPKATQLIRKIAVALSSAGLLLGIDATYAANLTPTGCSLTRPAAQAAFGADPARPFLSDLGNVVSATNAPSTAGTSISGTEASTSFVTELIAQRRVQEAQICPVGFERLGGICQPVRKTVLQERSSRARSKPITMTSLTGRPPSTQPRPPARPADLEIKPESGAKGSNAFWAEAFYDYEKRTGLGSPLAPASRAQQTSEFLFGGDHTFQNGDTQLILGALGSFSRIGQSFSRSLDAIQDTLYTVDLSNVSSNFLPNSLYDYVIPTNHTFATQERQTLSGFGGGITASIFRGGFFSDGLFKFDLLNLTRTSTSSDTYLRQLSIAQVNFDNNTPNPQTGCISVVDNTGNLIPNPYTLSNLQSSVTSSILSTTAANFVFADTVGYHFGFPSGYWLEPLVGGIYTYSTYGSNAAALGLMDGQDLRLQAGLRLGLTKLVADRGIWTVALTELVYSDVLIRGYVTNADGFSAGALLADQGKVRLQSILTSKFSFQNGLSIFLECQGRVGDDYWAYGGRVGSRFEF